MATYAKILNSSIPVVGDTWKFSIDSNGNGGIYIDKVVKAYTGFVMKAIELAEGNLKKALDIFVTMCSPDGYGTINPDGSPVNWNSNDTKVTRFKHSVRALELNGNIATI